jgi:hypothetical protein
MPDSAQQQDRKPLGLSLPGIGHNQPPEELVGSPAALEARLQLVHADLLKRFVELEQGIDRVPAELTEEEAQRAIEFTAKQCGDLKTDAKKLHTAEKEPYLECGRAVDKFFLRRIERFAVKVATVETRAKKVLARMRAEQAQAEEAQRRRAAEERRQAEAEALRLEDEAKAKAALKQPQARADAVELGRQAEEAAARAAAAAAIVEAPPAPVRLHGEYGGATAYFTEQYEYEIEDPTLIPISLMTLYDPGVRALIKGGARDRDIPGLRIFPVEKFRVRKN